MPELPCLGIEQGVDRSLDRIIFPRQVSRFPVLDHNPLKSKHKNATSNTVKRSDASILRTKCRSDCCLLLHCSICDAGRLGAGKQVKVHVPSTLHVTFLFENEMHNECVQLPRLCVDVWQFVMFGMSVPFLSNRVLVWEHLRTQMTTSIIVVANLYPPLLFFETVKLAAAGGWCSYPRCQCDNKISCW
jgi:hypothetical protein